MSVSVGVVGRSSLDGCEASPVVDHLSVTIQGNEDLVPTHGFYKSIISPETGHALGTTSYSFDSIHVLTPISDAIWFHSFLSRRASSIRR